MSKQSIADKSAIIRNETQKYANTRGRVADVLDDINDTKADNVDLEAEATARAQGDQTNANAIAAEATARAQGDDLKLDKPLSPNNTNAFVVMGDGSTKPAGDLGKNIYNTDGTFTGNRSVDLAAYYLYFYNSTNTAKIGINKINPTEALDIVGRMRADGFILASSAVAPLPKEIKFKGGNFVGAKDDGIEHKFLMDGDLDTELATKLDKGGYSGTAQDLKNNIDGKFNKPTTTSNTTSYPYVVGEDGNGNSARLPAGDLGKNFFNSDLSNTTARNHTMNAGVTVKTLGNPHTLSGLPNKNADIANFRKVRVQNASGLDSVVDSKNLLTDGVTSMTDTEKDAWRLAQRKSTETYSTGQPRIDFILPLRVSRLIEGVQYVSVIGLNLFLNLADCEVKLINTSTDVAYPINVIQTSQANQSQFSFGYDFSTLPLGIYRIYVRNGQLINIDNSTFEIIDNVNTIDLSSLNWSKWIVDGSTFSSSYATGINLYRQLASTSGEGNASTSYVRAIEFLSDVVLTEEQANGNWSLKFKFRFEGATSYCGRTFFGLVDANSNLTAGARVIGYGMGNDGNGGGSWRPLFYPIQSSFQDLTNLSDKNVEFILIKKASLISFFANWNNTYFYIETLNITGTLPAFRLLYTDNKSTGFTYGNASNTLVNLEISI